MFHMEHSIFKKCSTIRFVPRGTNLPKTQSRTVFHMEQYNKMLFISNNIGYKIKKDLHTDSKLHCSAWNNTSHNSDL
jgi:hypothetical protein